MRLETKVYELLGQHDGYYTHPPLDERKKYFGDDLIKFNNDGFEVWFGTADNWHTHYRHETFQRMVAWYLYQRIVVDWCGLRTWIWYKLLHRQCAQYKPKEPK